MSKIHFSVGEPVPWFEAPSGSTKTFNLSQMAGRYVVLCFFGSSQTTKAQKILTDIYKADCFNDEIACFFGITCVAQDEMTLKERIPGIRFFWDFEGKISHLYGALDNPKNIKKGTFEYKSFTLVLDTRLRVLKYLPINDPEKHVKELNNYLKQLPHPHLGDPEGVHAPVLIIPRIFEPEFCKHLIDLYQEHGGEESGTMREKDGKTIGIYDYSRKRRDDYTITDSNIQTAFDQKIKKRLIPEIARAFQFKATRIERHIVACYQGEHGGHFTSHRDNTTKGTAHRRFAVTINLNTGEYDGGNLIFPEFGQREYTAPLGGAVVFSCSLLHKATPVISGDRYCTLPFLYNDEAAKIRKENLHFLQDESSKDTS